MLTTPTRTGAKSAGPTLPLAAFCRNNDSGSHAQMERFFLNGSEINADIRRERTSVLMASILTDVQNYEAQHPGEFALGYSMFYYYQNAGQVIGTDNLKLLSVDGVLPAEAKHCRQNLSAFHQLLCRGARKHAGRRAGHAPGELAFDRRGKSLPDECGFWPDNAHFVKLTKNKRGPKKAPLFYSFISSVFSSFSRWQLWRCAIYKCPFIHWAFVL